MKTMKKLIALLMTLVTVVALFALPVSAASVDAEDLMRYPVLRCECGGAMRVVYHHDATNDDLVTYDIYECDTCHRTETHIISYG